MTDNTQLNTGTAGDVIRTIDRTTAKTQVVGLDAGGEAGPESLVTSSNGLPSLIVDFSVALRKAFLWALNRQVASEANGGRIRVVLDPGPGPQTLGTVTTVTTVGTVTSVTNVANVSNIAQFGAAGAGIAVRDIMFTPSERLLTAARVRSCIA